MKFRFALSFVLMLLSGSVFAGYNSLVVLGDSLSDMGNGSLITGGIAPGTPTGRASNGPVAVEYLAQRLGIHDFKPSRQGGTNYSVFGATTGTANFSYETNVPTGSAGFPALQSTGLQAQFAEFALGGPFNPASTLFTIWGGANDIFLADVFGQDLQDAATTAASNLMGLVGGLLGLGAQNILLVGLPDLALSPFAIERGPLVQAGLTALTESFNDGIENALGEVRQLTGANLMFFDPAVVTDAVIANPAAFGITNLTDQCILSPEALATNCAGYAFLDDVHPSTAIHALFGRGMAATVAEPSSVWLAAAIGLVFFRARRDRQKART